MCGLAGYFGKFDPALLTRMQQSIAHRGPDGHGEWADEKAGIGLAHRRLSIIDLSVQAAQPMWSSDKRYCIVFNGEIYNFRELAQEMSAQGYSFNEASDTSVLLPLYDAYKEKMLDKLSGIFAFAIWDCKEQELFIARDHAGIKPLYYAQLKEGLIFSSELKGLAQYENLSREFDETALFSYLTYLWCPGERTMLKGVNKLLPGHYMKAKNSKADVFQWYTPPLPVQKNGIYHYDKTKTSSQLRQTFDDVVAEQLVSDVPVGAFLSGGVDSSAVVASMCQQNHHPADTFCITFEGQGMNDEGFGEDILHARQVAKQYGVKLHEVVMNPECLSGLEDMAYILDEPQADPAPLYVREISRIAKESGIKVLLSGTGGDDVFSGYRRHQVAMAQSMLSVLPGFVSHGLGSLLQNTISGHSVLARRLRKLGYILSQSEETSILGSFYYTQPQWLMEFLSPDLKKKFAHRQADHLEKRLDETKGQHVLTRMLDLECHGFLPDHNLNYTDKMGMMEGIEIRVPFVDRKIIDFAHDLPINRKVRGQQAKYILKKAMEPRLPHDVLYRRKAGFGAPVRNWLKEGPGREWAEEILHSASLRQRGLFDVDQIDKMYTFMIEGKRDAAYTILSLIMVELWCRQFMDKRNISTLAA